MKKGLIFGTFDGLHKGHFAALSQAKKEVDYLVIALPSDQTVFALKQHAPKIHWEARKEALMNSPFVDSVVLGDEEAGQYHVVDQEKPDVIFLGYDQDLLKADLEKFLGKTNQKIELISLPSFHPEIYKSSLLNSV